MGSPFLDRLEVITRFTGVIVAGIPSTCLIPLPLTLALTRRYRREERLRRLHFMVQWARFCRQRILQMSLSLQGSDLLPRPSRGHIYISNHQSYLDILLLMEALGTGAFLSKSFVKRLPVLGLAAYGAGTIFFERETAGSRQRALRDVIRMCEESTAVVIFPEGTRSYDGELSEKIHPGAIRAAYQHGLKVVPVGLDGTYRVLPKAMDHFCANQRVAVTIGAPMDPADCSGPKSWVEAVWGRVTELFQQSRARLQ